MALLEKFNKNRMFTFKRPLLVYFHSFLVSISIQIEKRIDGVHGIQTRGLRMEGADETTELWRPPKNRMLQFFCYFINTAAAYHGWADPLLYLFKERATYMI